MKTAAAAVLCLYTAVALIARPTVALPVAEDGNEYGTSTFQATAEEKVTTTAQSTVDPETTTFQSTTVVVPVEPSTAFDNITVDQTSTATQVPVEESTATQVPVEESTATQVPVGESTATQVPVEGSTTAQVPVQGITAFNLTNAVVVKDKLSEQIRKILKHYQQPDPVGFPGAPIPDPLSLPTTRKSLGFVDMTMINITVHGLSKFEIDKINADLKNMTVFVILKIKRLYVLGNYTLTKMFGRPDSGPFNVTLLDVEAAGTAALSPDELGHMQATDTEVDMQFDKCELDFENMSPFYRDSASSFGPFLFEFIKPFVIDEFNNNMKTDVNAQLKAITGKLPKLEVPMPDLAVAEGRAYVRRMGYDPYRIADRHIRGGPLNLAVTNLTITGLSNFRRVGDIGLEVRGAVLQMTVHVITGQVNGSVNWSYQLGASKVFSREGQSNVTVDHVQVLAVVNQTLDVRQQPVLDRLDIEVGRVTVHMDGKEPVDLVVETALNSLPDLVRHIIVDALEEPIKIKVQTILDEVQVEKLIEDRLPELDRLVGE